MLYYFLYKCYTIYMLNGTKKTQGKFICSHSEEELRKRQLHRMPFCIGATVFLTVPWLILGQHSLKYLIEEKKITAIPTALLLLFFVAVCFSVFCLINSFFRYKLVKEIPAQRMPKLDHTKHTWSAIEWQFWLIVLFATAELALTVYKFSVGGLVVTLFAVVAAACAFMVKRLSFDCYRNSLTEVSLDKQLEDAVKANDTNIADSEAITTVLPKIKNEDATEDFYDDRN